MFSSNGIISGLHLSSRGMQITIQKGPNDQLKRLVNSDTVEYPRNKVNFRERKHTELPTSLFKANCVTANVSMIII